jgi:hypothetical protein
MVYNEGTEMCPAKAVKGTCDVSYPSSAPPPRDTYKQSVKSLYMFKSFTAKCFGSCINSHHQAEKISNKSYYLQHTYYFASVNRMA